MLVTSFVEYMRYAISFDTANVFEFSSQLYITRMASVGYDKVIFVSSALYPNVVTEGLLQTDIFCRNKMYLNVFQYTVIC